jgi:hypothetical protein
VRPSRPRATSALVVVVLLVGVVALAVSTGQRLAAQITLAGAQQQAAVARQQVDEATGAASQAAAERESAALDAERAEQERTRAQSVLTELQEQVAAGDPAARLAAVEELVTLGAAQADRFAQMNEAALAGQTARFNGLVERSNAAIERTNELWRTLISSATGLGPSAPVA